MPKSGMPTAAEMTCSPSCFTLRPALGVPDLDPGQHAGDDHFTLEGEAGEVAEVDRHRHPALAVGGDLGGAGEERPRRLPLLRCPSSPAPACCSTPAPTRPSDTRTHNRRDPGPCRRRLRAGRGTWPAGSPGPSRRGSAGTARETRLDYLDSTRSAPALPPSRSRLGPYSSTSLPSTPFHTTNPPKSDLTNHSGLQTGRKRTRRSRHQCGGC